MERVLWGVLMCYFAVSIRSFSDPTTRAIGQVILAQSAVHGAGQQARRHMIGDHGRPGDRGRRTPAAEDRRGTTRRRAVHWWPAWDTSDLRPDRRRTAPRPTRMSIASSNSLATSGQGNIQPLAGCVPKQARGGHVTVAPGSDHTDFACLYRAFVPRGALAFTFARRSPRLQAERGATAARRA
jgi:hypothetical protein